MSYRVFGQRPHGGLGPGLCLGSVVLCICLGAAPGHSQDDLAWGISRIDGTSTALPTTDLSGFYRAVGDAQIVGLGESIHTSGGFYRAKERLIRGLVEDQGFRAFALETPWSDAEILNRYVQTCSGSPEVAVIGSMFPVWAGEAMRDLAVWMCEWNRRNPNQKIVAYGFDVQQPQEDLRAINAFFSASGFEHPDPVVPIGQCYTFYTTTPDQARIDRCLGALDALRDFYDAEEPVLIAATSSAELDEARIREVGLRAWQLQISLPQPRNFEARDGAMAEVFEFQRRRLAAKAKTIVWAHNGHLTRHPRGTFYRAMGYWLERRHGSAYQPIGLFAGEVFIDWRAVGCGGPRFDHAAGDLEDVLGSVGGDLFVDFSRLADDHPILQGCRPYSFSNRQAEVPLDHFGGAVFLETSPPMEYLQGNLTCGAKSSSSAVSSKAPEGLLGSVEPSWGVSLDRPSRCARPTIDSFGVDSRELSGVTLAWESSDVTNGHRLQRWQGVELQFSVDLASGTESFSDTGLEPGQLYRYVLTATNRFGVSDALEIFAQTEVPDLSPCTSGAETVCLGDGRFEVRAEWTTADSEGIAQVASPGTDDSGVFWFFAPDNWEMLVKVLDGCAVNGHHWVFATATTDVGYVLDVRDTQTGARGTYTNLLGEAAKALIDTSAFSTCSSGSSLGVGNPTSQVVDRRVSPLQSELQPESQKASCSLSEEVLCLQDGRIQVEIEWDDGRGNSGRGRVAPVVDTSSGLFWFFSEDNWEILIKVLDGCVINGHRWVFFGGTTDVGLTVRVTDRETGETRVYTHAAGTPANTVTDTEALTCS